MSSITNLRLWDRHPQHQIHLLLWNHPIELELKHLIFYNHAERINYRENLLTRLPPEQQFLTLHYYLDREIEAIKSLTYTSKNMVFLEGLDCLIAYLNIQDYSLVDLFWSNLEKIRKLEKILWILLPEKMAPHNWSSDRVICL